MGLRDISPMQERQIREARLKGAGYRSIAVVLGLDRDTVRNYCVKHKLHSESEQAVHSASVLCPQCRQPIVQNSRGRHRKFCSNDCRRKWWTAHPEAIERRDSAQYHKTCAYCGKEFMAYGDTKRRYCCHHCYIRDRFGKVEDGRLADTSKC